MLNEQIKHMVDRFLMWKLPESFNPDGGVSFKRTFNEHTAHPMKHEPSGTNLLDATQADAMVRHMIEGMPGMSAGAADVLAERRRQQTDEGWTRPHDDAHSDGSLAAAAAVYAMTGSQPELRISQADYNATLKALWPISWDRGWFKRKDSRRDLVRAGALIIAEIERLDRAKAGR